MEAQAEGLPLPAPCEEGWPWPWWSAAACPLTLWFPVQRQIQEEPLDYLSSSIRQQAMETMTQLR